MSRPGAVTVVLVAAAATLVAGCGGGGSSPAPPGPDPATLVPPDVSLYAEAVVRPEGDQREDVESALSKLLGTHDPGEVLIEKADDALREEEVAGITYEEDIEPWLGPRAAIFFETFAEEPEGAAVLSTTDPEATQQTIDALAAADPEPERTRTYHGVEYGVDRSDIAVAIVGDFFVAGTERGVRDVIDASAGESLADSSAYAGSLRSTQGDRLALAHLDPGAVVKALERSGEASAADIQRAGPQVAALLATPITVSVSTGPSAVTVDVSTAATEDIGSADPASLFGQLPEDAWFAFAAGNAGSTFGPALAGLAPVVLGSAGADIGAELQQWLGDAAGFMSGTDPLDIGGAVVLQTRDEQASAQTLDHLRSVLAHDREVQVGPLIGGGTGFRLTPVSAPIPFTFEQVDGRVIAGFAHSVDEVLDPAPSLGDSESFGVATGALGDVPPAMYVDFEPILEFLDGIPDTSQDPDYQAARPYLSAIDFLVLGAGSDEDRSTIRAVLGLH